MAQLTIRAIILVGLTQFHELVHLGLELNSGGSQRWETREGFIMLGRVWRWRGAQGKEQEQPPRAEGAPRYPG